MEGKPEKPPNSGYSLYSKELLASQLIKHVETKDRMSEISRQWKALTEEERHQYNDRAQEVRSTLFPTWEMLYFDENCFDFHPLFFSRRWSTSTN